MIHNEIKEIVTKEIAREQTRRGFLTSFSQHGIKQPYLAIQSLSKMKASNPYYAKGLRTGLYYLDNGSRYISFFMNSVEKKFIERNKNPCFEPLTGNELIRSIKNALIEGETRTPNEIYVYSPALLSEEMIALSLGNENETYKKAIIRDNINIEGDIVLLEKKLVIECKEFSDSTIKIQVNYLENGTLNSKVHFSLLTEKNIIKIKNALNSGFKFAFYIDLTSSNFVDFDVLNKIKIEYFFALQKKLGNYPIILGKNIDFVFITTQNISINDPFSNNLCNNRKLLSLLRLDNEIREIATNVAEANLISSDEISDFALEAKIANAPIFNPIKSSLEQDLINLSNNIDNIKSIPLEFTSSEKAEIDQTLISYGHKEDFYTPEQAYKEEITRVIEKRKLDKIHNIKMVEKQTELSQFQENKKKSIKKIEHEEFYKQKRNREDLIQNKTLFKNFLNKADEEYKKNHIKPF